VTPTPLDQFPEFMTTEQVAQVLKMTCGGVQMMRRRKCGPPYFKINKSVRYARDDFASWLASRRREGGDDATAR
jgi:Helix-turn-helix domain